MLRSLWSKWAEWLKQEPLPAENLLDVIGNLTFLQDGIKGLVFVLLVLISPFLAPFDIAAAISRELGLIERAKTARRSHLDDLEDWRKA